MLVRDSTMTVKTKVTDIERRVLMVALAKEDTLLTEADREYRGMLAVYAIHCMITTRLRQVIAVMGVLYGG